MSLVFLIIRAIFYISLLQVFPLWAVSPLKLGGLNYTTDDVGKVLSISGTSLMAKLNSIAFTFDHIH